MTSSTSIEHTIMLQIQKKIFITYNNFIRLNYNYHS